VLLGSLYLMALCAERAGRYDTAETGYNTILALVLELYDSQVVHIPRPSLSISILIMRATQDNPDSASPFELELVSRLAPLLERRGEQQKAEEHRARGQDLASIFPHTDSATYACTFHSLTRWSKQLLTCYAQTRRLWGTCLLKT